MLTIATITPKQGEWYYKQENYYSKGAALSNSEWWGRGAATLGLSGHIGDNDAYKNLINGFSPGGTQKLREKPKARKSGEKQPKERAGVDLTFSAPKSVSLACLVGGDKRLEEAHRTAVKRTLELIEKRYAQTRVKGKRVKTDNLTVALWHHDTSRELDPHLHTHCVVMNATQLPKGKWQSRTDENLYYNKILLGRFYRNELAVECQRLGYEIEPHPKELFEIKGYTREQIEGFSKRHEQILNKLAEIGAEASTENKVWAWRKTRAKKNHEIDRDEMLPYWEEEADLYGIVHPVPSQSPKMPSADEIGTELQKAVQAGIDHCSEREVAFKLEAIEKFIGAEIRPFRLTEIERVVKENPDLLLTFDGRFTTNSAVARELKTIRLMQQGKNQVSPIAHPEKIDGYLEGRGFTAGQKEAIAVAATTTDKFIAWQGVAGAGKTYALNQLRQIAVERGYTLKGFAPSAEAAKVLGEEVGIEATTVASLLCSKQPSMPQAKQIWLVDEAGLLSAPDALALLERATQSKARVILVGDTRQLSAVEAGNPFKSLQQAGITTAHLNESRRQKPPDLQKAVNLAAAGEIIASLNHLVEVGRIVELPNKEARASQIAADYISLSPGERQQTLIVAGTNAERLAITKKIRSALFEEGSLGYGVEATKLKAKDLTQVQASFSHYYEVGNIVMPTRTYRKQGLHKFQPYLVEAVSRSSLTLSDQAGNRLTVNPMKFRKTVYTRHSIEIAVGDKLRWTKNDKELGRRNGQEFTVIGINGNTATISIQNGKTDSIDLDQPLHLDYALVSTTYSSQGKTADRVLISASADPTVSQESFYVAISRAKYDLKLYAQDKADLLERAKESRAKENPLELLRQRLREQLEPEPIVNEAQTVAQSGYSEREVEAPLSSFPSSPTPPVEDELENSFDLSRKNHEPTNPQQSQSIDGANLGKCVSERLNAHSRKARPHRGRVSDSISDPGAQPTVSRLEPESASPGDSVSQPAAAFQQLGQNADDFIERIESANGKSGTMEATQQTVGGESERTNQRIRTDSRHLNQNLDNLTRRNAIRRGRLEPTYGQARPGVRTNVACLERTRRKLKALADQVRSIPLEEVAQRLGLQQHRYDKHKWKSDAHIISINGEKFYDHLAMKGGGGAIDLVMHVQGLNYFEALSWLSGSSPYITPSYITNKPFKAKQAQKELPDKFPACNIRDESKWLDVKRYLTEKRGLPEQLVSELHQQRMIHADSRRNVMFFRHSLGDNFSRGEAIGASLRGTEGDFKGLTPGTHRDAGYFWFQCGQGEVARVILTESPIDAMSFAALEQQQPDGATVYLGVDGAGSVPEAALRSLIYRGGQVIVAYDHDRAGEEMAWKVAQTLPGVSRMKPALGKDWNEQLLSSHSSLVKSLKEELSQIQSEWKRVAQALGRSENYLHRITVVTKNIETGQPLSDRAREAMQQDFQTYRQTTNDLWQWHNAAKVLGKSETYLHRITEVALDFNGSRSIPLSEKAAAAMQQDLKADRRLQLNSLPPQILWQKYSQGVTATIDAFRVKELAQKALQDGCSVEVVTKMLLEDPYFWQMQQQLGTEKTQLLAKGAVLAALKKDSIHQRMQRQKQHREEIDLEL